MSKDPKNINLSGSLLDAWRETVVALAKLPRGTDRRDFTPEQLLTKVLRQESSAAADLWQIFTSDRGELARNLLSDKRRVVAYLVGFHLANAARTQLVLRRADERFMLSEFFRDAKEQLTWHDIGTGTGAVAQALADFALGAGFAQDQLRLELYDAMGPLLDAARILFAKAGLEDRAATHRVTIEALSVERMAKRAPGAIQGYSLGYVWNELVRNPSARARLMSLFTAEAAHPTMLLLLEPATDKISRGAMELRDQLVAAGYVPLYHCPAATPCPMLKLSRDWCYSEGEWQRPKAMQLVDKALGIDRSRISGSLFAFASKPLAERIKTRRNFPATPEIVVGRPERIAPGKRSAPQFDYLVCLGPELKKVAPEPGKNFLLRGLPLNG